MEQVTAFSQFFSYLYCSNTLKTASLRAAFAKMFQAFADAFDQRFFLSTAPALELTLPCQALFFLAKHLRIDQTNGVVLERVSRASTVVVGLKAGIEVPCGADIETVISTAKDVDIVH